MAAAFEKVRRKDTDMTLRPFFIAAALLAAATGAAVYAQGVPMMAGRYMFNWSSDAGSGSEEVCLADMHEFRDPAHIVAIYVNNYSNTCSTEAKGAGVYGVSCTGALVEGTLTVLSAGATSFSVSGGVLVNTDNMGGRTRTSMRLSAQRLGDC